MTAWSTDEARPFLREKSGDRMTTVRPLALTRGMRRDEICVPSGSAIDLDNRKLTFSSSRIVVDGKAIDSAPKTGAGIRSIPLGQTLVGLL